MSPENAKLITQFAQGASTTVSGLYAVAAYIHDNQQVA